MVIHPKSVVVFHNLKINTEPDVKGMATVVRWDTDETVKVDPIVISVIHLLSQGKTIDVVCNELNLEIKSVINLLYFFKKCGFIKQIDETVIDDVHSKITPWLAHVKRNRFEWICSKKLLTVALLFIIFGNLIGIFSIVPLVTYQSFFWTHNLFLVYISLLVIEYTIIILHEAAHFIATKAVGGEAKISISYRFIYLVFETESYHLGLVSKKKRFFVYLAGIFTDLLILSSCLWILTITKILHVDLGIVRSLLLVVVLVAVWKIVWQCNVTLETDIFNVITDAIGMENIRSDVKKTFVLHIKRWKFVLFTPVRRILLWFFNDRDVTESADNLNMLTKKEKKQLSQYSELLLVGLVLTSIAYFYLILPRDYVFVTQGLQNVSFSLSDRNYTEGLQNLFVVCGVSFHYLLIVSLILRDKLGKKKSEQRHSHISTAPLL
jgi:hypothetical protein